MFTNLTLENFKSWEAADVSFGRVNLLFGTNSSGKSSLIQFMLLLKQTMEASDRSIALDLNGPYVKLGTPPDVIFEHDEKRKLYYDIHMELDEELTILDPTGNRKAEIVRSDELKVEASVSMQGRTFKGTELIYLLGEETEILLTQDENEPSKFKLETSGLGDFKLNRPQGKKWNLPGPVKSYQFPDQARTYFQNAGFLSDLEHAFEKQLGQLFYVGPLRENPKRDYLWAHSVPTGVGTRGENTIDAILAAQEAGHDYNLKPRGPSMKFQEMVAYWLKQMGLVHEFRVVEIAKGSNRWQVKAKRNRSSSEVLLPDMGSSVSQVLPIITLLYYVPEGSTVLLEQPEAHLHPLAQAELADLIINVATHRKIQIILESHSEHLLLRLQRRVAEEKLDAEDVYLYFCDASKGTSNLEELLLDSFGNIENWPESFMGDAFTETAEAELARIERNTNAA